MKQKPIEYESSLTRHLILYSKGHYKMTADIRTDLKLLMSNYSGASVDYFTDELIFTCVSESFVDSCTKSNIKELLKCFYRKPFSLGEGQATLEEMVSHMIGMMACIQVKERKGGKWIELVKIGKPNPEYMLVPKDGECSSGGEAKK